MQIFFKFWVLICFSGFVIYDLLCIERRNRSEKADKFFLIFLKFSKRQERGDLEQERTEWKEALGQGRLNG